MKIGLITDIHSNLAALEAAVRSFHREGCTAVICCGDVIGIGPEPEKTVRCLQGLPGLIAVRGNHERYLTEGLPADMSPSEAAHHRWQHGRLSAASVAFLTALPDLRKIILENHCIVIQHYAMDAQRQYLPCAPKTDAESLRCLFPEGDIVLYGHDHRRCILEAENRWYINAGALGCPRTARTARAGILTLTENAVSIEPLDLAYDVDSVIGQIDRLNYPDAQDIKCIFYGVHS